MRATSLLVFAFIAALHMVGRAQQLPPIAGDGVQLGRYTTAEPSPAPSVANPLSVIATVSFPRGYVQTVGDAMRHLLARTGYQLVAADQLDENARYLLQLPLPESHRQLGPYRVEAMLQALLGDAWRLQVDSVTRTVRFAALLPTASNPLANAAGPQRP